MNLEKLFIIVINALVSFYVGYRLGKGVGYMDGCRDSHKWFDGLVETLKDRYEIKEKE